MEKFQTVTSNIATLEIDNIDTDMIIPKQFLKTLKRSGLGKSLFYEMRYTEDGKEVEDFILNTPQFKKTQIIVAGSNFGCGSSREHAPWAIKDFGIKVIIANSFADIFYNNCFKNGILPIVLKKEETDILKTLTKSSNNLFEVNLELQTISSSAKNFVIKFEISQESKSILLEGLDDISQTLVNINLINSFELKDRQTRPWIYE